MSWYNPLRSIQSRGSQADRPGSLAGLAAARKVHLGQFFTPDEIARVMWRIVEPAMLAAESQWRKQSIMDNSCGSGRLLQYADPQKHILLGVDVDAAPLARLGEVAVEAGFECEFEHCGVESIQPRNIDVALINPPFSVHLESPTLKPYPCTTYGKYGPGTAAVSHAYALAQAVEAADIVVALLPRSFVDELIANPTLYLDEHVSGRFHAVIDLPSGSFREEGTEVQVSLVVMGHAGRQAVLAPRVKMQSLDDPLPELRNFRLYNRHAAKLGVVGVEDEGPSITLPVTGDNTVRIVRDGRRIKLRYACGLTMAKVHNAILRETVTKLLGEDQRFPKGVKYEGQGVLDLEVHLAQDDPMASFNEFVAEVRSAGGSPVVDPGIYGYLKRAIGATLRQKTPLRHVVYVENGVAGDADSLEARPRRPQVADPKVWGSPALSIDQCYHFARAEDGQYAFEVKGRTFRLTPEDLYERFEVVAGAAKSGWTVVHEGLPAKFPEQAAQWRSRAAQMGLDKVLSWGYQYDDLIELAMQPKGAIAAWDMGLGKARLATALITLHGSKHGLIATEAGLVEEMVIELDALPIPKTDWQVITKPEQLMALRRINVISYERLRMEIGRDAQSPNRTKRMRKTYAGQLRRRIGVAVFDEGDLLCNPTSDQARACEHVSPKKRFVLTATPIANYPRDMAPIQAFTAGDGTAAQPWGWRRGKLDPVWRKTMNVAQRGLDAFRDTFVCTEWVTKEFTDTLTEGAKREIPRIANLEAYRAMVAPLIKRRIVEEPEVSAWVKIIKEDRKIIEVPWDHAHLAYYLKVVEEFSNYYHQVKSDSGRKNNLIAILARIRAVSFASDFPQYGVEGFGAYTALTSKQRWVLDELERLTAEGKKTILYAENPRQVELLHSHLEQRGVESMTFHGGKPIKKRTKELNTRFRFGDCPVLLATLGTTQKGLNLWQASEVLMLGRSWSATTEEQAIHRLLRPQQKLKVRVRYIHLPGGIDIYKDQLVSFKRDSARAGLDWATPDTEDADFLHLDSVIGRFVDDMAKLHNVARHDVRKLIEANSFKGVVNV